MKLGVLNPGDNADLLAGVATGTFGQAGVVLDNRSPSATGEGKASFYTTEGALKGTFTLSLRSGGEGVHGYTIATGAGTITSGTQMFKGFTGQFTFEGKSPAGLTYFIVTLKGSYTT